MPTSIGYFEIKRLTDEKAEYKTPAFQKSKSSNIVFAGLFRGDIIMWHIVGYSVVVVILGSYPDA